MNQIHQCNIIISEIHNYVKKNIQTYVIHTGLYTYHGGAGDVIVEHCSVQVLSELKASSISSNGMSSMLIDFLLALIINASKKPLSIDNIPLEEIEEAFSSDKTYNEQCSTMMSPAPP